jgi:hypothetical protein
MPTPRKVRKASARTPVRIVKVIGDPKPAAKSPGRSQAGARVTHPAPVTSPSQAHALRGALGRRSDLDAAAKTAKELTARRQVAAKAEAAGQGHPGRQVDVPAAAKPTHVSALTTTVVTYGPGGQRLPDTPIANALVWQHTYGRYIAAGHGR